MTARPNSPYINPMPISIHLPDPLLRRVDSRAKQMGLSRSSYIATILERELAAGGGWSDGFFDRLRDLDLEEARDAAEAMDDVTSRRRSRLKAPTL